MTVLTEIGTRVDTDFASLTLGTNLFLGQEPDSPDDCVTIHARPGGAPQFMMDAVPDTPQVAAYEPHRIQIVVRKANTATAYADAETLAWQIYRALTLTSVTLSSVYYLLIEPTTVPAPLDEDAHGRISFVVNLQALRDGV
jgi:hypothetical protein